MLIVWIGVGIELPERCRPKDDVAVVPTQDIFFEPLRLGAGDDLNAVRELEPNSSADKHTSTMEFRQILAET